VIEERHRTRIDAVVEATLTTPGATRPSVRRAAHVRAGEFDHPEALAGSLPPELFSLVDKIARHAFRVTDQDIRTLLEAGWSEDALFELIVATATGAGLARLNLGLAALPAARR
jgi:alkylhydroperoxidase family enzyme